MARMQSASKPVTAPRPALQARLQINEVCATFYTHFLDLDGSKVIPCDISKQAKSASLSKLMMLYDESGRSSM